MVKKGLVLISMFLVCFAPALKGASNTFIDYQNYNHGYCPTCNCAPCACNPAPQPVSCAPCAPCAPCEAPCDPCAPVCGTKCGISVCAVGVAVVAVAVAAAIIISSGNGSSTSHSHN